MSANNLTFAVVYILIVFGIYDVLPVATQTTLQPAPACSVLPQQATVHESLIADSVCGLYCDDENTATPLSDSTTNKSISVAFLALLVPALICNLIFTANNAFEHRDNEETFQTTPITYDCLFVIDGAYLVLIVCLMLPHLSHISRFNAAATTDGDGGGNTVSSTYICNTDEATVSVGNPTHGNNALCTILGLMIFSAFKLILFYTAILCINIWYRLWKPMIAAGIRKRYIHIGICSLVVIYDIFILAFGAISADPATGTCYVSATHDKTLLILVDTLPNVCFVVISALCITNSVKQIRHELNVLKRANLVTDDLVYLIHRMVRFLIATVVSALWAIVTNLFWFAFDDAFKNSVSQWIQCTQHKLNTSSSVLQWSYDIGDACVAELRDQEHVFPSTLFFLSLPIAALVSNMSILMLTCHRRHSNRWKRQMLGWLDKKPGFIKVSDQWAPSKKPAAITPPVAHQKEIERTSSFLALKSPDTNGTASPNKQAPMSIHVEHSSHGSSMYGDPDRLGTVRVHNDNDNDNENENEEHGMTFGDDAQATPTGTPGLEDYDTVVVRHETPRSLPGFGADANSNSNVVLQPPAHSHSQSERVTSVKQHEMEKQRAFESARNLSLTTQTEMLVSLDRNVSNSAKERLEHVANASFDYHNAAAKQPLSKVLFGIERTNSDLITVDEEDLQRSEQTTQRLREKTKPELMQRSSTGRHFNEALDQALDDLEPMKKTNTKSVKFADEDDAADADAVDVVSQTAAEVVLRRTNTDSLLHRSHSNERTQQKKKVRLKKLKTSMDVSNMNALDLEHLSDVEIDADIDARDREPDDAGASSKNKIGHGRNLSHQQREQQYLRQAEDRRNQGFFDRFGVRKRDLHKHRHTQLLKPAAQFVTSSGHSLMTPSAAGYLTPITCDTQFNIDPSYFDDDNAPMPSQSSLHIHMQTSHTVEMDALQETQTPMEWQNTASHFFTLTNDDFRTMLHTNFTPHSTRINRQMTFDPAHPYVLRPISSEEPMTPSGRTSTPTELTMPDAVHSLNALTQPKHDRSVTAIGSDGRIVVSHPERFNFMHAQSDPNAYPENHEQKHESGDNVPTYQPPKGGHRRNKTIHDQLLDKLPEQERKNLIVTFYADASANICEQGNHWKAETAKLNFTLKPVQSMKILL